MYTATARAASARVIGAYSTSFGLASRLLPRRVRGHIADIYALVRVADEVVDGPASEAGVTAGETLELVDALEHDTLRALRTGFSANLVVHAFAVTARRTGIDEALVRPFFASMRTDARGERAFDDAAYRAYIYGSAEVVGSMCLRAFAQEGRGIAIDAQLDEGARKLGAAFQKVNFLRDLADDCDRLGRTYLPGIDPARFTDADKDAVVDDIDADLAVARRAIDRLPPASRRATAAAWGLFARLNRILAETPAAEVRRSRASVPPAEKARILALAAAGRVSA
nr:squalene/phytoene synthase family protein [Microbacterium excoecariae]